MSHYSHSSNNPVGSIITVVYNGADTLERTIKSIIRQTYDAIEYIVVDGGSKDGTHNIINKYRKNIHKFISEPDNGLYDAMNKGMQLATGEYLWFINSGDEVADENILTTIFNQFPKADIYYGDTIITDMQGHEIGLRRLSPPEQLNWKDFRHGMVVSHQSVIVRVNICHPYILKYKYSADYEWVLYALKHSATIINTHLVLSRFLDGGLTKKNILPGLKERFNIMTQYFGLLNTIIHHFPIAFKFINFIVKYKRF